MTIHTNQLLEAALKLSVEEREELVDLISESLPSLSDEEYEEWEAAWEKEIARRIKDSDEGRAPGIPWEVVKEQLEREFGSD